MQFPMLYKKTSTGADQFWLIWTEGAVIHTQWGQVGGAIQDTRDLIKSGKNLGKKNETSPEQQAELEAQSQWEKKLKKGYVKSLEDARAEKTDECIEGGVSPMLAHKFSEQAKKITYPALVQPKFDGHRCIAIVKDGKASLWSRTRKPITGLPHLITYLETLSTARREPNFILDGELYNHEYKDKFEELSSFIRSPKAKEGYEVVQYHVYDLVNGNNQSSRLAELHSRLFDNRGHFESIILVETGQIAFREELDEAFAEFLDQGYEGLMVRNINGYYVNKRSYDLQKVKEFDDAEFRVIGVEEGRGKLAGKAIFVLEHEGREFRAKMKGKLEDLEKYVKDPSLAIGRLMTVRFFGFSNANRVPRFPVGIRFHQE